MLLVLPGCQSCSREERRGTPSGTDDSGRDQVAWTFDGERIVAEDGRTIVAGPLMKVSWGAVTDSESQRAAWLPVPEAEESPPQEIVEGYHWEREGIIRGPGVEISETLADKQLIKYKWEAIRKSERALTVTYKADLIDHVVFSSFSNFELSLPLSPFLGAAVTVNETYGGVIPETYHGGPSHPSYWEGPAQSVRFEGQDLALELAFSEGGFSWVSIVEGRALSPRDTVLVIQLYPAVAGPRDRFGTLAWRGTAYSASFTITIDSVQPEISAPTAQSEVEALDPPVLLHPAIKSAFDPSVWELAPFTDSAAGAGDPALSLGNRAHWCELALENKLHGWDLDVAGLGHPRPSFVYLKGPVKDFYLTINGKGDFRHSRELLNQLGPLPQDPRARAEEVWRYASGVTYAMPLHPTDDLGEFLGSYGYGFSSTLSAMALTKLWESAGLSTRRAFVLGTAGHATLGEVFYEGDWHAYDLFERTYYVNPEDWSPASAAELSARPDLVRFNRDAGGMSPSGANAEDLARDRFEGAEISYNPGSFVLQRTLGTSLRRGETFIRFYEDLGRWAPAPREPDYYANALLAFCPDLNDGNAIAGFYSLNNLAIREGAMVQEDPALPASFEYRAVCPYVIVESTMRVVCEPSALEGASLLLSKDLGATWETPSLDHTTGRADFTEWLVAGPQERGAAYEKLERNFDYLVHLELPALSEDGRPARIDGLEILTWSQVNAALLPRLKSGKNKLVAKCGEWDRGASLGLAWIEPGPRTQPESPVEGQTLYIEGEVFNNGRSPSGDFAVKTYAYGASGLFEIGLWRPENPVSPGESRVFSVSCDPPDLRMLYPASPPQGLEIGVEIRRENGTPGSRLWDERSKLAVDLESKPDLVVISGLSKISPSRPAPGQQVEVGLFVRNFCPTRRLLYLDGASVPSVKVALFELKDESRQLVQETILNEIQPGGGAPALFSWTAPPEPGPKRLLVVVDPEDEIDERDENNSALLEVHVVPSRP